MKKTFLLLLAVLFLLVFPAWAEESLDGPVLVAQFPAEAEMTANEEYEDGSYLENLIIDGKIDVVVRREPMDDTDILDMIGRVYSNYDDVTEVESGRVVAGYPAREMTLTIGEAEAETRVCRALLIPADQWRFILSISTPVDDYDGYKELIDWWLESADLFDTNETYDFADDTNAGSVFSYGDIAEITDLGCDTIGDYMRLGTPVFFNWHYEGDDTGATQFTVEYEGGDILTLTAYEAANYQDDAQGMEGVKELPEEAQTLYAWVSGMAWANKEKNVAPLPRGLHIGDEREKVLAAFSGETVEDISSGDSGYEELIRYELNSSDDPEDWREYYTLSIYLTDGVVEYAQLTYRCDSF